MGALIGTLVAGKIADKIGRNKSLLLNDIVYVLGAVICTFSLNVTSIAIGRFIVGVGVGFSSVFVPSFINEISPKEIRGSIGVLNQLSITIGILVAFIVNSIFSQISDSVNWRIMFALSIIPSVIHFVAALIMKLESPRWLFVKGDLEGASAMIKRLRGNHGVSNELDNLALEENEKAMTNQPSRLCIKKNARPLLIGVVITFIQQAVGVNAIL